MKLTLELIRVSKEIHMEDESFKIISMMILFS